MSSVGTYAGLLNLRDVATIAGITSGVLLRSDAPVDAETGSFGGVEQLPWPPATVIDLRSDGEAGEQHPLEEVAVVRRIPLFDELAPDQLHVPDSLAEMYIALLERPLANRLIDALEAVAASPGPVLVHCTAGKDRTGVVVATALALARVDRGQIIADYAATQAAMPDLLARWRSQPSMVAIGDVPPHLTEANPSTIEAFLNHLDEVHGGARRWFVDHGGDVDLPDRLVIRLGRTASTDSLAH